MSKKTWAVWGILVSSGVLLGSMVIMCDLNNLVFSISTFLLGAASGIGIGAFLK